MRKSHSTNRRRFTRVALALALAASAVFLALSIRQAERGRAEAIAIATRAARVHDYDDSDTVVSCARWGGVYSVQFRPRIHSFGGGCLVKVRASDGRVMEIELSQ
jgi:hypothetical protein